MSVTSTLIDNTFKSIDKTRQEISKLTSCSTDWTSGAELKNEIDALEHLAKEFIEQQLGIAILDEDF